MRKAVIVATAMVLMGVGIIGVLWAIHAARYPEVEIVTAVAQEIIRDDLVGATQGYKSPEGTVIVEVSSSDAQIAFEPYRWFDAPYRTLWKYGDGALNRATTADVDVIKREGTVNLYLVVVRQIKGDTAFVDVAVRYARSGTVGFLDGGCASHWRLKFVDQVWIPIEKDDYSFWD